MKTKQYVIAAAIVIGFVSLLGCGSAEPEKKPNAAPTVVKVDEIALANSFALALKPVLEGHKTAAERQEAKLAEVLGHLQKSAETKANNEAAEAERKAEQDQQ